MRFLSLILCLIALQNFSIAQPWLSKPYLQKRSKGDSLIQPNFYEIQKAFNKYEKKEIQERNNEAKR
ncbi:MAG: hypothetical protein ABIQ02_01740 [Saprospiraceae bacterium]